jgi:hypothetical protein
LKADTSATNATEFVIDPLLQIREPTSTNLDLRSSLKELSGTIEKLQAELEGFRNEINTEISKPSPKRQSSLKQAAAK